MARSREWPGDASSLIYMAKCDAFADIERCVPGISLSPMVWKEAVEAGEDIGAPEVVRIRDAEARGFLRRVHLEAAEAKLADSIAAGYRLGRGESEVLALGKAVGRCIVDEGRASRVATSLGILPISTLFLPVLGRQARTIGRADALSLIRRLAVVMNARAEVVFALESALKGGKREE